MTTVAVDRRVAYREAFTRECAREYPMVDAYEARCGFAVPTHRLRRAAEVLACPVKVHAPNWQHGRVLYAAARQYLAHASGPVTMLDIGTAKGFSALCLLWAARDADVDARIVSVDVIDPHSTEPRNTVAELDGPVTLYDILKPWPESRDIVFLQSTGIEWLERHGKRVHVAFVDGKHTGSIVRKEGVLLAQRQMTGDLAIFDDVHIPDVSVAVNSLHHDYRLEYLEVLPHRHYAIGVRR